MQGHGLLSLEFDTERVTQLIESVERYVKAKEIEKNIIQINMNQEEFDVNKYTTPGIPLGNGLNVRITKFQSTQGGGSQTTRHTVNLSESSRIALQNRHANG
jgi:hypothetical protein